MITAQQRNTEGHHLTFRLAGEQYSISIQRVREIIEYDSVRPVPGTPKHVRGVINLRGAVVPVIDIALKFGLDKTPITKDTCIIILDVMIDGEPGAMGVMTEAVSEVLELASDDIEAPPAFGTQVHVDYLIGMSMVDGRMALVLDIDEVLQTSEIVLAIEKEAEASAASTTETESGYDLADFPEENKGKSSSAAGEQVVDSHRFELDGDHEKHPELHGKDEVRAVAAPATDEASPDDDEEESE